MGYYKSSKSFPLAIVLVTALITGVVSSILTLTISPAFTGEGIFSRNHSSTNSNQPAETVDTQPVSVDVNSDVTKAVEKALPAVVGVINVQDSGDPFSPQEQDRGSGSGIVYAKENGKALIVTNHHVIAGANEVRIVLSDDKNEKTVTANVLGSDEATDLAVLEIPDDGVGAVAEWGNSDTIKAGEPAIAIGNPIGMQFYQSVTSGIISSPKRQISISSNQTMDVIQTDAAINPGNSGGALVNGAGQVIGINSMKVAQTGVEGIGFAIPINEAKPIIQDLIQHGKVQRPFMGIAMRDLDTISESDRESKLNLPTSVTQGVVLLEVSSGSSAAKAGLNRLDVIVELDGKKVQSAADVQSYLWKEKEVRDNIKISYYRDGSKKTASTELQER
ncbi:S1C family serine protease [Desmospora activa]|uniref:Serine protease Do n=1 Tax=Desmospora activa DSM 45169 TaxID=1121389 RepID=A0A2T4Z793_9BACL|nr:trypsin-like peptidase domain-containing protein [Desmospora activa]PTM57751.1 serine protease Do [Desmospora activa DSM 45169]